MTIPREHSLKRRDKNQSLAPPLKLRGGREGLCLARWMMNGKATDGRIAHRPILRSKDLALQFFDNAIMLDVGGQQGLPQVNCTGSNQGIGHLNGVT